MKYEVEIKSEARGDMEEAAAWYEEKRNGLGEEFTDTILDYAEYLSRNAYSHPKVNKEYRELAIKRFPYVIVYRIVKESQVIIVGVIHMKKHPSVRRKRK